MYFPVNNDTSTEEPQNIQDRAFQPFWKAPAMKTRQHYDYDLPTMLLIINCELQSLDSNKFLSNSRWALFNYITYELGRSFSQVLWGPDFLTITII
jgi:hypothetical protein